MEAAGIESGQAFFATRFRLTTYQSRPTPWLHIGCISYVTVGHSGTTGGNVAPSEDAGKEDASPSGDGACVVLCQSLTPLVGGLESGGGGNRTRVP